MDGRKTYIAGGALALLGVLQALGVEVPYASEIALALLGLLGASLRHGFAKAERSWTEAHRVNLTARDLMSEAVEEAARKVAAEFVPLDQADSLLDVIPFKPSESLLPGDVAPEGFRWEEGIDGRPTGNLIREGGEVAVQSPPIGTMRSEGADEAIRQARQKWEEIQREARGAVETDPDKAVRGSAVVNELADYENPGRAHEDPAGWGPVTAALVAFGLLLGWLLASPVGAQIPRPKGETLLGSPAIASYIVTARFDRVLVVDKSGRGDCTTIKACADKAAALTPAPSSTAPVVVEVFPGVYPESPFTIPAGVTVQGRQRSTIFALSSQTRITLSHTTGAGVTCSGGMANLGITHTATLTAPAKMIYVPGGGNCKAIDVDVAYFVSSATHAYQVAHIDGSVEYASMNGYYFSTGAIATSTNTTVVDVEGDADFVGVAMYVNDNGATHPRAFRLNGTGRLEIHRSQVGRPYGDPAFTLGVEVAGGGTAYLVDTSIESHSGTVSTQWSWNAAMAYKVGPAMNCAIRAGAGSPEGAVVGNVCDLYLRTDGGAGTSLYVKESGAGLNTGWVGK